MDASAALSWLAPSQFTATADQFARTTRLWMFRAPAVFSWEVYNAMLSLERRRLISRGGYEAALETLDEFEIQLEPSPSDEDQRALVRVARETGLSLFDSAYFALAITEGCGLASRDGRLLTAARRAGVETFDLNDGAPQ